MSEKDTPESLRAKADELEKASRKKDYRKAIKDGEPTYGGHLGTCRALGGWPSCTCGKEPS